MKHVFKLFLIPLFSLVHTRSAMITNTDQIDNQKSYLNLLEEGAREFVPYRQYKNKNNQTVEDNLYKVASLLSKAKPKKYIDESYEPLSYVNCNDGIAIVPETLIEKTIFGECNKHDTPLDIYLDSTVVGVSKKHFIEAIDQLNEDQPRFDQKSTGYLQRLLRRAIRWAVPVEDTNIIPLVETIMSRGESLKPFIQRCIKDIWLPVEEKNIKLLSLTDAVDIKESLQNNINANDKNYAIDIRGYRKNNSLYYLSQILLQGNINGSEFKEIYLRDVTIRIKINDTINPIASIIKKCPKVTLFTVKDCNIPIIPSGTFADLPNGANVCWINNKTQHIQEGAFISLNNSSVDLSNNPLTEESRAIVLKDTQKTTFKELFLNNSCKLYDNNGYLQDKVGMSLGVVSAALAGTAADIIVMWCAATGQAPPLFYCGMLFTGLASGYILVKLMQKKHEWSKPYKKLVLILPVSENQ